MRMMKTGKEFTQYKELIENSIFPGARKRVKADEGPKTAVMLTPEEKKQVNSEVRSDQPIVKGIFDMVRTAKDTESNYV